MTFAAPAAGFGTSECHNILQSSNSIINYSSSRPCAHCSILAFMLRLDVPGNFSQTEAPNIWRVLLGQSLTRLYRSTCWPMHGPEPGVRMAGAELFDLKSS